MFSEIVMCDWLNTWLIYDAWHLLSQAVPCWVPRFVLCLIRLAFSFSVCALKKLGIPTVDFMYNPLLV